MYYKIGLAWNEGKQTVKRIETLLAEISAAETEIHFGE